MSDINTLNNVEFIDVGPSSLVAEGQRVTVEFVDRQLALSRVEGKAFAIDNRCPHRDGLMAEGTLEGHHLYCPLHAWCFDVRSGDAFFPRGATIACFDVVERDGRLLISRLPNNRPPRAGLSVPPLP